MKQLLTKGVFILCLSLIFAACGNDEPKTEPSGIDATKTAILKQYVNGVVVPTYKSLADEALKLSATCSSLKQNPTQELVNQACADWIAARKYWEQSEAFLYGAAADYYIDPHIDSWPLKKDLLDNTLRNEALMAELDENGAAADGFSSLGYGLMGFHAVEYVIFREGKPRNIADISTAELIYVTAVAQDLANQTVRLEAAWAGINNVSTAKQNILEEFELEPSINYGQLMIDAGLQGNSIYKTQLDAIVQILQGASDIADEVGNTKITDPCTSGNVLDVESWYSWNSIADFADNIRSVRNAYFGSVNGSVNNNSLAAYAGKNYPNLDSEVRAKIDNAILKIEDPVQGMPAPFRNHLTFAENQGAIDACNELMDAIDDLIEVIQ